MATGCDEDGHDDEHADGHDDHGHSHEHGNEVINTVTLTFTPQGGGDTVTASFTDPDGDGGMSGSADPIVLVRGTTYDLQVEVINDLEDPAEDVTEEIREEAEEHYVFISGDVSGPSAGTTEGALVMHAYADLESTYSANAIGDDLPVGLVNTIVAAEAGMGHLDVQLQHLPELNGEPQKTADLPQQFADGNALPGSIDVAVEFELTVE